jgi:ELWxxDGT repeat protein
MSRRLFIMQMDQGPTLRKVGDRRDRVLRFEPLEERRLLSGDPRLIDVNSMGLSSNPYGMTELNGLVFFSANNAATGAELWKSDGTEGGTELVKDIRAGIESSLSGGFVNVNGALYFSANDGTKGVELWKTDGTEAGTRRCEGYLRRKW